MDGAEHANGPHLQAERGARDVALGELKGELEAEAIRWAAGHGLLALIVASQERIPRAGAEPAPKARLQPVGRGTCGDVVCSRPRAHA